MAAWIKGNVFDGDTKGAITTATVSVGAIALSTALGGYYLGQVPPGTHVVTATANGYRMLSDTGVEIGDGQVVTKDFALMPTNRRGDVNGDAQVDLADAILALKIAGNMVPDAWDVKADVNGDAKIGLQEAIYILQEVAGLR